MNGAGGIFVSRQPAGFVQVVTPAGQRLFSEVEWADLVESIIDDAIEPALRTVFRPQARAPTMT